MSINIYKGKICSALDMSPRRVFTSTDGTIENIKENKQIHENCFLFFVSVYNTNYLECFSAHTREGKYKKYGIMCNESFFPPQFCPNGTISLFVQKKSLKVVSQGCFYPELLKGVWIDPKHNIFALSITYFDYREGKTRFFKT